MILVTGASGFVGQHVARTLWERLPGRSIRLFDANPPAAVLPDGVEAVCGFVEEHEPLASLVQGAEVVVHLAARVQPDSQAAEGMWRVNVEGTRNVFSAAVEAGCKLFLHMSSAGVYGPPRSPNRFREGDATNPLMPYQRSKWEAEEALRQIDPKATTLNILRPAGIYGPGSQLEIPDYKKILTRRWTVELSGGVVVHPTHVQDVAEAVAAIVTRPATHGAIFNLGGARPLKLQDLQALVAGTLGVPRRRFVLPAWSAGPLAAVAQPCLGLMGRPNPLLARIGRGQLFSAAVDDGRFRRQYPEVPVVSLRDGLREHLEWARAQRLL